MSSSKQIIAVVGATGNQGGGLVRDLLEDGTFAVRGLTRNPESAASKGLANLGVEVVKADLDDVESLQAAFSGAYGVFGVTDFFALFGKHHYNADATEEHEFQQGKNIVDAAKAAGVTHVVWSTLDHFDEMKVPHFESKARVANYLAKSDIPKYTLLYTSGYFSNIASPGITFMPKDENGNLILINPVPTDTKVHYFDCNDVGKWVLPIFKNPSKYAGQRVDAVTEYISTRELAEAIKRHTGAQFTLVEVTKEQFHDPTYRSKIGEEIWLNMLAWEAGYCKRDIEASRAIAPNAKNLETFLKTDSYVRSHLGVSKTGVSA